MQTTDEQLIDSFFTAFQQSDTKALLAICHEFFTIEDPLIEHMTGNQAHRYCAWLVTKFTQSQFDYLLKSIDVFHAQVEWSATFQTYSRRKKITLHGRTKFSFVDNKISRLENEFSRRDIYRQLYGTKGYFLPFAPGFTTRFRQMIEKQVADYHTFRDGFLPKRQPFFLQ